MPKRFYFTCLQCGARMTMFSEDADGERRFYFCSACGDRRTYNMQINGAAPDWPKEVFEDAMRGKVLSAAGRVL